MFLPVYLALRAGGRSLAFVLLLVAGIAGCDAVEAGGVASLATSPLQPASGPGGSSYAYAGTTTVTGGLGAGAWWRITPTGAGNARLPVVYLLHGYGALDPSPYRSWIEHLARRGAIVIYPAYQLSLLTAIDRYTPNAVAAIRDALSDLASRGGVVADLTRVAAIGHSMGGAVAANLAAIAGSEGLPQPRALMVVSPANQSNGGGLATPLADFGQIPAGTLLLSLYSDADLSVTDALAKQIFYGANNVTAADKDYLIVNSDAHGFRALVADHFAALAGRRSALALYPPDALDFFGYWKLADALMSAAFTGSDRDIALGHGSAAQTSMGNWSDGEPVRPMTVLATP